jgi:2-C-methyl-D-erythritol 4-phosphate cytidylyltransferase
MKKYAVIVAGGSGTRMGGNIPKQFQLLSGKPLLWYTLNTFLNTYDELKIILVVAEEYLKTGENILQSITEPERIVLTGGGQSRFQSVRNGLQQIKEHSIIFVHDAVRCLVSSNLIHRCYESTLEYGNAIPVISSVDSLRIETASGSKILDRDKVKIVQTPQTFYSDIIKEGYEQDFNENFTDEASVVERLGIKINLIEGEETNIKITRPTDLLLAEKIMQDRIANLTSKEDFR